MQDPISMNMCVCDPPIPAGCPQGWDYPYLTSQFWPKCGDRIRTQRPTLAALWRCSAGHRLNLRVGCGSGGSVNEDRTRVRVGRVTGSVTQGGVVPVSPITPNRHPKSPGQSFWGHERVLSPALFQALCATNQVNFTPVDFVLDGPPTPPDASWFFWHMVAPPECASRGVGPAPSWVSGFHAAGGWSPSCGHRHLNTLTWWSLDSVSRGWG